MRILWGLLVLTLAAACGAMRDLAKPGGSPAVGYRYLDLLVEDGFDSGGHWRSYADGPDLFLGAMDGKYLIDFVGRKYVWAQSEDQAADIVIEAEATQLADFDHNAFGLACRLDSGNRGRGYYFLISGDGYASIRWSDGRSLRAIAAAAPAAAVNAGKTRNLLRVVCIQDYLALWVNGELVAEARDRRATEGAAGMVGVMNYEGRRLKVAFDNLKVWRAAFDDRRRAPQR